jgi:hypothetical protein
MHGVISLTIEPLLRTSNDTQLYCLPPEALHSSYEIFDHHKYEFEHILKLSYEVLTSGM